MFSTGVVSTSIDPEFWISLVMSNNSNIQAMLGQEDDTELDNKWFNSGEWLTHFCTYRDYILGGSKE